MLKKILMTGISSLMVFTLGACGNREVPSEGDADTDVSAENKERSVSGIPDDESMEKNNEKEEAASDSSVLIAYFSWSGKTKQLAEMIQDQIGGEIFEIKPETPYTHDINKLSGIALQEQRDDFRPALSGSIEDMNRYDVVFIGFPNWWNNMPMPVFTFLEKYDFSGKKVIPFTTYGDGVWGESVDSIQEMLPEAVMLDGLAIQEHTLQDAGAEVSAWLQGLNL